MPTRRETILERLRRAAPVIAPSMLKCDFGNLHREIELLESAGSQVLHLDVMDGHFVPNLSYGPMVVRDLRPRTNAVFDAHLMISEPGRYLDAFLEAGCDTVVFHVEAEPEPAPLLKRIHAADAVAGLAISPGTPAEAIEAVVREGACDLVLVMSVEPGFGGQSFMPDVLPKLDRLKRTAPDDVLFAIDGGVGPETIARCAAAGADLFVVGSAIFESDDYGAAIRGLVDRAATPRESCRG